MTRINCRNPECGFTRSATVTSTDGEHIPECIGCGDQPYINPRETTHIVHLIHKDPEDDSKLNWTREDWEAFWDSEEVFEYDVEEGVDA